MNSRFSVTAGYLISLDIPDISFSSLVYTRLVLPSLAYNLPLNLAQGQQRSNYFIKRHCHISILREVGGSK